MNTSPDDDYKAIFSHPDMVIDIITGFAPGPWLDDIDFATLEPFKSSFVAQFDDAEQRHADLVWRVRHKGSWMYVYLLFEFQSTVNPWMAVRMLVYVGLLYQEIIKNKGLDPDNKLPFILPIVLYNGNPRWRAPLSTHELISIPPIGLEHHVPRLDYFLIDEGAYDSDELAELENLAAAIFLIETQTSMEGLGKAIATVLKWARKDKHQTLRAAVAKLATRVIRKRFPGTTLKPEGLDNLEGVFSMLSENIDIMILEGERKGRQEGRKEGRQEGMEQILKAMLINRFGPLPDWATDHIAHATPTQLADWCVQLLHVTSLAELFGDHAD